MWSGIEQRVCSTDRRRSLTSQPFPSVFVDQRRVLREAALTSMISPESGPITSETPHRLDLRVGASFLTVVPAGGGSEEDDLAERVLRVTT